MLGSLCSNDAILIVSLTYSCFDLWTVWTNFGTCQQPIHHWLFVTYASILFVRLTQILSSALANSTSITSSTETAMSVFLSARQKGPIPRFLIYFAWCVALPLFSMWTITGTYWLHDVFHSTPSCMPEFYGWLTLFWSIMSYVWVFVHIALGAKAWQLAKRARQAQQDVHAIEDDDLRSRWGEVSSLPVYDGVQQGRGRSLSVDEINALPEVIFEDPSKTSSTAVLRGNRGAKQMECTECSICICDFEHGDRLRRLPRCGHTFHRSCIDLWLLRNANCPLCKCDVSVDNVTPV